MPGLLLLLRLLAFLLVSSLPAPDAAMPGRELQIASSGGCGLCLDPIAISRAQEAVEWAGPDHHIASAGSCVELDFWPTWFSIFDPKIRDCEAIEEPPNVVTSPCHASCPLTCRTSVLFCLD